jgi:methylase of polypeptide subunit release factors
MINNQLNNKQSDYVKQTIDLHREQTQPVTYEFLEHTFTTFPGVFSPFLAPSGGLAMAFAQLQIFEGKRVLDMGCGGGLVACFAALRGAEEVVGVDINPTAIDNAKTNARNLNVESKTDFREGDLFDPIRPEEKFDIIFANLPFTPGIPRDMLEAAFLEPDLRSIKRYINDAPQWLKSGDGRIFLCVSSLDNNEFSSLSCVTDLPWDEFEVVQRNEIRLSIVEFKARAQFFVASSC